MLDNTIQSLTILKVLIPTLLAFIISLSISPIIIRILINNEMWKKKARNEALGGGDTPIFNDLHKHKEVGTPRMGGLVIIIGVLLSALFLRVIVPFFNTDLSIAVNFISRSQTWVPIAIFILAGAVGFVDDYLVVKGSGGYVAGGLKLRTRFTMIGLLGLVTAYWVYFKNAIDFIHLPFIGDIHFGLLFIPIIIFIFICVFTGGVIDGVDGLSGGVFTAIFSAYGIIALTKDQNDIAALCFAVTGALLGFLWFNVPPAKFYMTETGIMALTSLVSVVAIFTNTVWLLPIIALPLFVSIGSVVLQLGSKKLRNGKKIFKVAPLHHHFEAIGWGAPAVSMRYWIISYVCALLGVILSSL